MDYDIFSNSIDYNIFSQILLFIPDEYYKNIKILSKLFYQWTMKFIRSNNIKSSLIERMIRDYPEKILFKRSIFDNLRFGYDLVIDMSSSENYMKIEKYLIKHNKNEIFAMLKNSRMLKLTDNNTTIINICKYDNYICLNFLIKKLKSFNIQTTIQYIFKYDAVECLEFMLRQYKIYISNFEQVRGKCAEFIIHYILTSPNCQNPNGRCTMVFAELFSRMATVEQINLFETIFKSHLTAARDEIKYLYNIQSKFNI